MHLRQTYCLEALYHKFVHVSVHTKFRKKLPDEFVRIHYIVIVNR